MAISLNWILASITPQRFAVKGLILVSVFQHHSDSVHPDKFLKRPGSGEDNNNKEEESAHDNQSAAKIFEQTSSLVRNLDQRELLE